MRDVDFLRRMLTSLSVTVLTLGVICTALLVTPNPHAAAQQPVANGPATNSSKKTADDSAQPCPGDEQLRKNAEQLNAEIQRLKRKVTELEKDRLATTIQEQLEKEEQRGEKLQLHLLEIAEKEAPLQSRMEQINQQLRPENVDRTLAGVGTVHPEDARDELKKRLLGEKIRLQSQLDLLRQDRVRTQTSLATTDASIQRLRQKLAEALRP